LAGGVKQNLRTRTCILLHSSALLEASIAPVLTAAELMDVAEKVAKLYKGQPDLITKAARVSVWALPAAVRDLCAICVGFLLHAGPWPSVVCHQAAVLEGERPESGS
jgi:hypothetical protein